MDSEECNQNIGAQVPFYCDEGKFSQVANLFFDMSENGIKSLFHKKSAKQCQGMWEYNFSTLVIFFLVYYALACLTYGISVPSGLFVPSLFAGAAFGRFWGNVFDSFLNVKNLEVGTYSLIGAAAMLGGMARMTISLSVILIEATGNISYGLPIFFTILVTRLIGNLFNEGLYDIHINLKHIPFLEHIEPKKYYQALVQEIMTIHPITCPKVASLDTMLNVLDNLHNYFPVIDKSSQFLGIIRRY